MHQWGLSAAKETTTRLCPVQVPLLQLTDPSLKKEDEEKRTILKLAAETHFNYFIYLKHTPGERLNPTVLFDGRQPYWYPDVNLIMKIKFNLI
jgi:hypothetical protein